MIQSLIQNSSSQSFEAAVKRAAAASRDHCLDGLLELVCLKIQLSRHQHETATGHYEAVSNWLAKPGSPLRDYRPHIFPQGSLRLGTTTKPLERAEFDLDLACLLEVNSPSHPGELYKLIWDRLQENGVYADRMKRLPRCIRIAYSGDFHLDIVPAIRDTQAGGSCILVPDLDANLAIDHPENDQFKPSNPIGLASWFEDRCYTSFLVERYKMAKVDPVPEPEAIHEKPALKRSVQLMKRWRDVAFRSRQNLATPSIILTTLCGHLYRGQPVCSLALETILDGIVNWIESGRSMCLTNPANPKEKICERWEERPESFDAFANGVSDFRDEWNRLRRARSLVEIEEGLSKLFDEAPVRWAIKAVAEQNVSLPRVQRTLRVAATGALGVALTTPGLAMPPNTFFGDNKDARTTGGPS